jgi:hypothetical protein
MQSKISPGFADRLSTQAEAKKALLAKFKPKAAVAAPEGALTRDQLKAQEREATRLARAEDKARQEEERRAQQTQRAASALAEVQAALEAKRAERKDRKAAAKEEARLRRQIKRA